MAGAPEGVAQDAVNRALGQMDAVLDDVVGRPAWAMSQDQQRRALVALARHESRLNALRLAVVAQAEADGVGVEAGATSTAAWHADATGQTPAQAFRLARQAKKLDVHDSVRSALAAGDIRLDQAEVIADAVDALPARPGRPADPGRRPADRCWATRPPSTR